MTTPDLTEFDREILAAIDRATTENPLRELTTDRRTGKQSWDVWARFSVRLLAGRDLSGAETKKWQRAIGKLEQSKLVQVVGRRGALIRLTKAGRRTMSEGTKT